MDFLKYFILWLRYFFMFFGAWAMFHMINNVPLEQSLSTLKSSSFFGLILSIISIISDIFKNKQKKTKLK